MLFYACTHALDADDKRFLGSKSNRTLTVRLRVLSPEIPLRS